MIKKLTLLLLWTLVVAHTQTIPTVTDRGLDNTHKNQHERTIFYKIVANKQVPCGVVAEFKNGGWHVFLVGDMIPIPPFDTRSEAVKWIMLYCPKAGKAGHD
jgi:hypothetical protein